MATLCLDLGTSVIKAVVFGANGEELAVAREPTSVQRPRPERSEQDMTVLWAAIGAAVRCAVNASATPIGAIAITGQGDGLWLVDQNGEPTGKAILWNDGRAARIVERWTREGLIERGFRLNGGRSFSGAPNAILAWLIEHEPERLVRSHALLSCTGFVFLRMTGIIGMDVSDAGLPFLDACTRQVADEAFDLFGIGSARRLMPAVLADDERRGTLRAEAAAQLGLAVGTPVVLAPYDIACMALGIGAVEAGQASVVLGTTICTQVMLAGPDLAGAAVGINVGVFDRTLRALPSLAGCEVADWTARLLGVEADAFGVLAARAPAGANGVQAMPYLSPAGERVPFFAPDARGGLIGLTLGHERQDIARAVLEALCFVVQDCLQAMAATPTEIRVCGGGARSDEWCRIMADVTGCPVLRSADREVGARGALVAARAVLEGNGIDAQTAQLVQLGDRFDPDPTAHTFYMGAFTRFLEMQATLLAMWRSAA